MSGNSDNKVVDFINQFLPSNRKITQEDGKIFFGIDFDATLVNNDAINLEVDATVVAAVVSAWQGKEVPARKYEFLSKEQVRNINEQVAKVITPLDREAKARLMEVLSRPNVMGKHIGKEDVAVAWPVNQEDYNASMAGKPINDLLNYLSKQAKLFDDEKAFMAFINDKIVKDVEVASINKIVPLVIKEPFKGWFDTLEALQKSDIPYAIVTSSELRRVVPVLRSSGLGKYFGVDDNIYNLFDKAIASEDQKDWDVLYNTVKDSKDIHLYSAAEEKSRDETFNKKPAGDIYALAVSRESQKRDSFFRSGAMIEDSGSMACIKGEFFNRSNGIFGSQNGETGVNTYDLAIGFVAASNYKDKKGQADKLRKSGADVIAANPAEVLRFIRGYWQKTGEKVGKSLTGADNHNALASTLAKYANKIR